MRVWGALGMLVGSAAVCSCVWQVWSSCVSACVHAFPHVASPKSRIGQSGGYGAQADSSNACRGSFALQLYAPAAFADAALLCFNAMLAVRHPAEVLVLLCCVQHHAALTLVPATVPAVAAAAAGDITSVCWTWSVITHLQISGTSGAWTHRMRRCCR